MRRIEDQAGLDEAVAVLAARDPAMAEAVRLSGGPPLRRRARGYAGLVAIVCAQQLSVAAAAAILARLEAGLGALEPAAFAGADEETLRGHGLSRPKARALKGLAAACLDGRADLDALAAAAPEEAQARLVDLPGVGPWTAQIYRLFCLGDGDAWPAGDLALQYAAQHLLDLPARPSGRAMEEIGARWAPLRGVAAFVLWTYYRALKQGRSGAPA